MLKFWTTEGGLSCKQYVLFKLQTLAYILFAQPCWSVGSIHPLHNWHLWHWRGPSINRSIWKYIIEWPIDGYSWVLTAKLLWLPKDPLHKSKLSKLGMGDKSLQLTFYFPIRLGVFVGSENPWILEQKIVFSAWFSHKKNELVQILQLFNEKSLIVSPSFGIKG